MPSPFPGMDPYLEGDLWQEFHDTLAHKIRNQLLPQLQPKYVAQRRLVTVIEILSPVNKWGDGARESVPRRRDLLATNTHLLEIDLLRRGGRLPFAEPLPPAPYYAFLSRFDRRPVTEVWAIALRQSLPSLPVPLLPPDEDVVLDLQTAVNACFDLVGYERLLDYDQPPPLPPFAADDVAWINGRVAATKSKGARIAK